MESKKQEKKTEKKVAKKAAKKEVRKVMPHYGSAAAMSSYLHTILAPHVVSGVKIPDANTAPSFTLRGTMRAQITATTTGVAATTGVSVWALVRVGYYEAIATTGGSDWIYGGTGLTAGSLVITAAGDKAYSAQVRAVASLARPVSCGMFVSYQGTTLTDSGRLIVAYVPSGYAGTLPPTSISDVLILPYLKTFPVKALYGQCVYLPMDEIARSYVAAGANPSGSQRSGGNYGYLYILADGLSVSAPPILEFTVVENVECLPLNNQFSLAQPTPSSSDPIELAVAANAISENADASVAQPMMAPQEAQAMVPSTAKVESTKHEGSSFLDKIVGSVTKIAEHVPAAVEKAAPLLAML